MEIFVEENPYGNVLVLNLGKVWPERGYDKGDDNGVGADYHAVTQQMCKYNEDTQKY